MWQPKFPTAHGDEGKISYWLNKLNYFKVKFQYVICLLWRGRWLRSTSFMYPIFLMCFMQLGVCWNAKVNWKIWINKLGLCMIHSGETQRSYTLFQVCGFFFFNKHFGYIYHVTSSCVSSLQAIMLSFIGWKKG